MSSQLEIFTLGGLEIRIDGVPVEKFPTRKVEALLVYLACTGRPQPRELLAELLWQERTQAQALSNLRTALARLNRQLAPFLSITRQAVAIAPEARLWVDAVALEETLKAALPATKRAALSAAAALALQKALALYGGDFLSGFYIEDSEAFESWLVERRESLRSRTVDGLHLLAAHDLERGDYEQAIAQATKLLHIDPLREEAHHLMMTLLARMGRRSAALAHYEICRQTLQRELDVEPDAETTSLFREIQAGEVGVVVPRRRQTLPAPVTPLIGRAVELAQIQAYLDDPDCRLLTLTGAGGIGKTRLAYQIAANKIEEFADGVCTVPLAGVVAPEYLIPALAEQLEVEFSDPANAREQLFRYLRPKHLLLVMDNCEHLLDGLELLAHLLAAAPHVKILATSRERLNLHGEWLFPVHGLSYPANTAGADLEPNHAVELFVQSARRIRPGYRLDGPDERQAVAQICRLMEGMPLAIELAASWAHLMPAAQIAVHIQQDLGFLAANLRDAPERHRSVRASFAYSWRQLSDPERSVLAKLSVFGGGFDAEAAAVVAGATLPLLAGLVDKSLARSAPSGRYDLHELIRQFAAEQLAEDGSVEATRSAHLAHFVRWGETAAIKLRGAEQLVWYPRIESDYDNLRAALAWAFDAGAPVTGKAEQGLQLANALWWFWYRRGYWREGYDWLRRGLAQTEGITPVRAYALANAVTLGGSQGVEDALALFPEAIHYAQALGLDDILAMGKVSASMQMPDYAKATELLEDAVAMLRAQKKWFELAPALFLYADRVRTQGDLDKAKALYQESLEVARASQNRQLMISPLGNLGRLAVYDGDNARAEKLIGEALAIARELGNRVEIADWLVYQGTLALAQGRYDEAEQRLEETLALCREIGSFTGIAHASYCLADLALRRGDLTQAVRLLQESLTLAQKVRGDFYEVESNVNRLCIVVRLACAQQAYWHAAQFIGAAEALRSRTGYRLEPPVHAEFIQALSETRAHLDASQFAAAWREGEGWTEDDVVANMLDYLRRAQV